MGELQELVCLCVVILFVVGRYKYLFFVCYMVPNDFNSVINYLERAQPSHLCSSIQSHMYKPIKTPHLLSHYSLLPTTPSSVNSLLCPMQNFCF